VAALILVTRGGSFRRWGICSVSFSYNSGPGDIQIKIAVADECHVNWIYRIRDYNVAAVQSLPGVMCRRRCEEAELSEFPPCTAGAADRLNKLCPNLVERWRSSWRTWRQAQEIAVQVPCTRAVVMLRRRWVTAAPGTCALGVIATIPENT